jgi:histidinol-phosphate phosphatase family protein
MQAVLLAGGKGTRLRGVDDALPKPLVDIAGRPVIFRQIDSLLAVGCTRITVIGGYKGDVLRERLVTEFGERVEIVLETTPLGTGGCLSLVRSRISEATLVISGDLVFDVDLEKLVEFHRARGADITLAVHPNNHPRDSDLVEVADDGRVLGVLVRPHPPTLRYRNLVNASIAVLAPHVWQQIPDDTVLNLERDIFPRAANVWAYRTPEYIKDMGTPERWQRASADVRSGLVEARSLRRKQKAVFVDRDGILNVARGYVTSPAQLELVSDAATAVRRLNESPYLTIVVTNQPQLARNLCSLDDLDEITKELETQLGDRGARLDDLLFCPHHPDKGFAGENVALKVPCSCRKPEPGMLIEAAARYNVELAASFMIGDSWRDIEAGHRAGVTTILVGAPYAVEDGRRPPHFVRPTLSEAVDCVLGA